jgi:hypothetical protein
MMATHMDEPRLSRAYLETLATDDLAAIADEYALDLPADLNRIFVVEAILDAVDDQPADEGQDGLRIEEDAPPTNGLPVCYHETFVSVLLRDPLWAYVFWEIKPQDRSREASPDFGGYRLRVVAGAAADPNPFTVPVGPADTAWYLCLPSGAGWYRVELCVHTGRSAEVLAVSAPFRVPRGKPALAPDAALPPVLDLSGLADFRILQGGDRQPREMLRRQG